MKFATKNIYKKTIKEKINNINKKLFFKSNVKSKIYFVKFIIYILCHKSNIFINVMDCLGNQKINYSIGNIKLNKSKNFKLDTKVLENFYKTIITKLKFLKNMPVSIYFNSIEFNYQWFLEKISKKLFLTIVKFYNRYSHNGCRKRKIKRKKLKRLIKIKKWLRGLKR